MQSTMKSKNLSIFWIFFFKRMKWNFLNFEEEKREDTHRNVILICNYIDNNINSGCIVANMLGVLFLVWLVSQMSIFLVVIKVIINKLNGSYDTLF